MQDAVKEYLIFFFGSWFNALNPSCLKDEYLCLCWQNVLPNTQDLWSSSRPYFQFTFRNSQCLVSLSVPFSLIKSCNHDGSMPPLAHRQHCECGKWSGQPPHLHLSGTKFYSCDGCAHIVPTLPTQHTACVLCASNFFFLSHRLRLSLTQFYCNNAHILCILGTRYRVQHTAVWRYGQIQLQITMWQDDDAHINVGFRSFSLH